MENAPGRNPKRGAGAPAAPNPWWKGARGEWFVVAQLALMALVAVGPRSIGGVLGGPLPLPRAARVAAVLLWAAGGALLAAAIPALGRALTPLPYPRSAAPLTQTGPYAVVRHPMYSGGLAVCLGWALHVQSALTLLYVGLLFVLLDVKSRREERWLAAKFPAYDAYRRRVRKLIPFLY